MRIVTTGAMDSNFRLPMKRVEPSKPKFQISLRQIFVLTVVAGIAIACLRRESPPVVGATLFCCLSFLGVLLLARSTFANLAVTLRAVVADRSWYPLAARIRWIAIDCMLVVWLIATIAVCNYVIRNHAGGAVILLAISAPVAVLASFLWRFSTPADDSNAADVQEGVGDSAVETRRRSLN